VIAKRLSSALRFRLTNGRGAIAVAFVVIAIVLSACSSSGNGDGEPGSALTPPAARFAPQIASSDLAVGDNRFILGLIDEVENSPVSDAQLHFRFFKLNGNEATLKSQGDAATLQVTKSYTHTHEDGTTEAHDAGDIGVYVATVAFDSPGTWGIEVAGSVHGEELAPVRLPFDVGEQSLSVAIGQPAPRSVQTIFSDVDDISEIDTSDPPNPEMHDITIADAVTSGRATVVVFATPAFCVSQICGPTKSIVDELHESYEGQANFVHVEPYDLEIARNGEGLEPLPFLAEEWGLLSEPWVFLVDSEGNVAAKFEAVVSPEEIEQALLLIL
jgi:hypothetical protein